MIRINWNYAEKRFFTAIWYLLWFIHTQLAGTPAPAPAPAPANPTNRAQLYTPSPLSPSLGLNTHSPSCFAQQLKLHWKSKLPTTELIGTFLQAWCDNWRTFSIPSLLVLLVPKCIQINPFPKNLIVWRVKKKIHSPSSLPTTSHRLLPYWTLPVFVCRKCTTLSTPQPSKQITLARSGWH